MIKINFFGSFLKYFKYGPHLNPVRDWLVLITLSAIVLAGVVVWNAWIFGTIAQGGTIGQVATSSLPVLDHSSLDTVHAIFANRSAEQIKYKTGVYRFSDPSQ